MVISDKGVSVNMSSWRIPGTNHYPYLFIATHFILADEIRIHGIPQALHLYKPRFGHLTSFLGPRLKSFQPSATLIQKSQSFEVMATAAVLPQGAGYGVGKYAMYDFL